MHFRGARDSRVTRQESDVVGQVGEDGDQVIGSDLQSTDSDLWEQS